MKICLDIKNSKVLVKDKANSVIVFNGKDYYATTIADLEKPLLDKIEQLESRYNKFEQETAKSILEMAQAIKTVIGGK